MAIVKGIMQIYGSVGGFTFYTRKGSKNTIMRAKGGPSKKQMENSPKFEKLRKNQTEFGGCSRFGSKSRKAFGELLKSADYPLHSTLTSKGKILMKMDTTLEPGTRNLSLSLHKEVLNDFNFNKKHRFSNVFYVTPTCEINRENLQATVNIRDVYTSSDIRSKYKLPFFRLIVVLGTVSDLVYDPVKKKYEPMVMELHGTSITVTGEWYSTHTILPKSSITVQMHDSQKAYLTENVNILISMGIEFGDTGYDKQPVAKLFSGCGKVIAVG